MGRPGDPVVCLCGDGEQQEGQIWEAAMFASKYSLDHLIAFTDDPNYRGMYPSLQRLFINAAMFGAGH
jgi:transketolase N-terminal domain/subunit